ncbi:MAG: hypothetical protein NUV72_09480 [Bauldia sp.]|nr:hypothetical protein [Bauldia sp.]
MPVVLALLALFATAPLAFAETLQPPMPNLSPARSAAAPGTTAAAQTQAPSLEGANSPLAEPDTWNDLPAEALPLVAEPEPALQPTTDTGADQAAGVDQPAGGDEWNGEDVPAADAPPGPAFAPEVGPPSDIRPGTFTLEARLAANDAPLGAGVKWRIFGDMPGVDGHLPLLGEADGGIIYIRLDPGAYFVHAAYGRAGATRKIDVIGPTGGEVLVLNAGGMRLLAVNGVDQTLEQGDVAFDIYAPDEGGSEERYLLVPNAPPGHVIPLNAGTYHVVSKYGDANAVVRADVKIDPGKLTEATIFQKAARLTLKLVEAHGGEAIADTAWSVVTQSGGSVLESVGAFPSVVLAEGDYTAIAKHDDRTFQANFTVVTGLNRDIEVLAE